MRKQYLKIIIFLGFIALSGGNLYQNYKIKNINKNNEKKYSEIYDVINSISYMNFENFLTREKNNKVVVYIGRPSCADCNLFESGFINFINEYHLNDKIVYLNVSSIQKDSYGWKKFKEKYHVKYTPTIAVFYDDRRFNYRSADKVYKEFMLYAIRRNINKYCRFLNEKLKKFEGKTAKKTA